MGSDRPGRDEIEAAHVRIAGHVRRTPLLETASPVSGAPPISLKLEFLQHAGSFKPRGAFNNLLTRLAPPIGCATASGGNHGAAVAYALVMHDADWFYAFVPAEMTGGRDPTATTAFLRSTLYGGEHEPLSLFAAFLFTHNAQIALFSFALGFVFCLPSGFLMIYNGCALGALFALFAPRVLGVQLGGWLFIHGTTELFAVALAGAAGFRVWLGRKLPVVG